MNNSTKTTTTPPPIPFKHFLELPLTTLLRIPKKVMRAPPVDILIIPDINSSSGSASPALETGENEKEKLSEDVGGDKLSHAFALDERYQAKVLIAKKKKADYQRAYTLKNKDKVYAKNKESREMKKAQRMAAVMAAMEQESRKFVSSDESDDEKELDAPKNAIVDPFMQHYMNSSAKTVALCGKHFSEQVFQFSELTKQCATAAEMEICLNKIKRLYGIFGGTATQCIESAKSFMESTNQESLSFDDSFGEGTTTTTTTLRELAPKNKIPLLGNGKRKRSILETNLLLKRAKYAKGIYTVDDIEYLMDCQIQYSPWLLAAKDDEGNYFAMKHLIKLMATKLERSITGLTRFLRFSKLRLADNEKADPALIEKMEAMGLYPWPFPSQQAIRAHMLRNILKM